MSPASRKRLGLASKPAPNKRQRIPKIASTDPELHALSANEASWYVAMSSSHGSPLPMLDFVRIMLRGAAREYDADSDTAGPEAMALERAALRYVYELLKRDDQSIGNYTDALDAIEGYAKAMTRE